MNFVYSDWKVFAENYLHIENDGLLCNLDIAAAVSNSIGRLVWGPILDYTNSYRLTMCMMTMSLFVLMITLPMCYGASMAFLWICLLWFVLSATYVILSPTLASTFGDKYCAMLTGLIMASEIIATTIQSGFFTLMQLTNIDERHQWITL